MKALSTLVWILAGLPAVAHPQTAWRQYASAAAGGLSAARLEAARLIADSAQSGAVLAVYRGNVVAAWGDVARNMELHSVRKSLTSALYGTLARDGKVDLDATLAHFGIDDLVPLSEAEKTAKLRDILAARSGVYHAAAYAADQDAERPARGAHAPGTHFFYNNWDFNIAETLLERLTGKNFYRLFDERIARPLGFEDYRAADGFEVLEPTRSRYPAHTHRMSARDLARVGQLYLQRGKWHGRQLIPAAWLDESTRAHSDLGNGAGYGFMWWTYATGALGANYPVLNQYDMIVARGTGGQFMVVIPGAEMVIVHRGDTDNTRGVPGRVVWRIAERIMAAREGEPSSKPKLAALAPQPFASQSPVPAITYTPIDARTFRDKLGEYNFGQATARLFEFDNRVFVNMPGNGEAELFSIGGDTYALRIAPSKAIVKFSVGADGKSVVELELDGRRMRGTAFQ